MNEKFLSEIKKGLNTFRVFEELEKFAQEINSLDQIISEKKKLIEVVKKDLSSIDAEKEKAVDNLALLKSDALVIISDAKAEAKKIKDTADKKRDEIISKAEKKAADIEKEISEKTLSLDIIKVSVSKESKALEEIRSEIDDAKRRFKNLVGA